MTASRICRVLSADHTISSNQQLSYICAPLMTSSIIGSCKMQITNIIESRTINLPVCAPFSLSTHGSIDNLFSEVHTIASNQTIVTELHVCVPFRLTLSNLTTTSRIGRLPLVCRSHNLIESTNKLSHNSI